MCIANIDPADGLLSSTVMTGAVRSIILIYAVTTGTVRSIMLIYIVMAGTVRSVLWIYNTVQDHEKRRREYEG